MQQQADDTLFDEAPVVSKEPEASDDLIYGKEMPPEKPTTAAGYLKAFGAGALKGVGEMGYAINKRGTQLANTLLPNRMQVPLPQDPFDYSNVNSNTPVFGTAKQLEQQYPGTSLTGQITGQIAGGMGLPGFQAAKGAGMLTKIGVNALNAGLSAPIYNAQENPLTAGLKGFGVGGALGAAGSLIGGGLNLAGNIGKRGYQVLTDTVKSGEEHNATVYDPIKDEANAAGFNGSPTKSYQTLLNAKQQLENSPKLKENKKLLDTINEDIQGMQENMKEGTGYSINGFKNFNTTMYKRYAKAQAKSDRVASPIWAQLQQAGKADVMDSLDAAGLGHLKAPLQAADDSYKYDFVPMRDNPVTPGGLAASAAVGIGASLIPHAGGVMLGTLLGRGGVHDNDWLNAARRFGSTYKGGPISILKGISPQQSTLQGGTRVLYPAINNAMNPRLSR